MSCYKPLKGYKTPSGVVFQELGRHDIVGDIELPCGMCIGCRMRRASDWTIRIMHEASMWESNCFITLTYERNALPPNSSLQHKDFQLFLKRLRKENNTPIRYYMCGEYGPVNQRPHYHACVFNEAFREDRKPCGKSGSGQIMYESEKLKRLWGHGKITVQELTKESAGYCARYIMKKQLGIEAQTAYDLINKETGETIKRDPEYNAMSLKPGIGEAWFKKFGKDIYPSDYVIVEGNKQTPPKYYDKLLKRHGKEGPEKNMRIQDIDELQWKREQKARAKAEDNTDERREAREKVHTARLNLKVRTLE